MSPCAKWIVSVALLGIPGLLAETIVVVEDDGVDEGVDLLQKPVTQAQMAARLREMLDRIR